MRNTVRGFSLLIRVFSSAVMIYRLDMTSSGCSRFAVQPVLAFIQLS